MGQILRVHPDKRAITLVGGAPIATSALKAALSLAPRIVAADGGADACLRHNLTPERVVGDMDSISESAKSAFAKCLFPVSEQDSTDFEKALSCVDAPLIIGVGFLGARIDHALAVFSHMARRSGPPVILLSEEDCVTLCPVELVLNCCAGDRVSLWPLSDSRLTSAGLHWPLDGLILSPVGQVGTSNRAEGPVALTCDGACLLILPAARLPELAAALGPGPENAGSG